MPRAVGDTGHYAELSDYDALSNYNELHQLILSSNEVTFPRGRWPVSQTLETGGGFTRSFRGYGVSRTELVCVGGNGPVIGVAGNWNGSIQYLPIDGFSIRGITLTMTVDNHKDNNCLFVHNYCNDVTVERVRAVGSPYEGFVIGGIVDRVLLKDIEAWDCGHGGAHFSTVTAGINPVSSNTVIDGFVCLRCGQGVESGQYVVTVKNGLITDPPNVVGPIGVNIGSNNYGIYFTVLDNIRIYGYGNAIQIGPNALGRSSRVIVQNCITDGAIFFAGGKTVNNVPLPPNEGPDTYGSQIIDNVIYVNNTNNGTCIYTGGINLADAVFGREPLTIARNRVYYSLSNPSANTSPVFGFGGNISGNCLVEDNLVYGLDAPPQRGDVQSFSVQSNPTIPGMPNLTVRNNRSFKINGSERNFLVKRDP